MQTTSSLPHKEYVIWGVAPNSTESQLLLTKFEGKFITNPHTAELLVQLLSVKGCTQIRIQTIDFSSNTFL